jgi:hypothetical protein
MFRSVCVTIIRPFSSMVCCNVLKNSFEKTGVLQPESVQNLCSLGRRNPNRLSQNRAGRGVCVFSYLLSRYGADGESSKSRIITGDETRIQHLEPQTKRQSVEWHHPTSSQTTKCKAALSAGRIMATVLWGRERAMLVCW